MESQKKVNKHKYKRNSSSFLVREFLVENVASNKFYEKSRGYQRTSVLVVFWKRYLFSIIWSSKPIENEKGFETEFCKKLIENLVLFNKLNLQLQDDRQKLSLNHFSIIRTEINFEKWEEIQRIFESWLIFKWVGF